MKVMWAPWRGKYIESKKDEGCIFCVKPAQENDRDNYIVKRGDLAFVMLNLYPYNNGHLLVAPYRHVGGLAPLTDDEMLELMRLVRQGTLALDAVYGPDAYNIGVNAGKDAGAGFADHVHFHVVPRWAQDTNFMPVISDTKVISEALDDTYERLVKAWSSLTV